MKKWIVLLALASIGLYAQTIEVFGATATKHAMEELKSAFLKERNGDEIILHSGSSGKAFTQFSHGMKYDMFFSADTKYPDQIVKDGSAFGESKVYAIGILALYALDEKWLSSDLIILKKEGIQKIAIANPKVAPYGVAAMEIFEKTSLLESVNPKLVMGDNLSQAIHFVDSGAAEVGLVAYALLKESTAPQGKHLLIDEKYYTPLSQSFVITKYGADKKLAHDFAAFVLSQKGRSIIQKYGFKVPL